MMDVTQVMGQLRRGSFFGVQGSSRLGGRGAAIEEPTHLFGPIKNVETCQPSDAEKKTGIRGGVRFTRGDKECNFRS